MWTLRLRTQASSGLRRWRVVARGLRHLHPLLPRWQRREVGLMLASQQLQKAQMELEEVLALRHRLAHRGLWVTELGRSRRGR